MRLVEKKEASVVTLVAEVRALMVGSRQITRSVFRQLDRARYDDVQAMGRVNGEQSHCGGGDGLWIVGRHNVTGELVRSDYRCKQKEPYWSSADQDDFDKAVKRRGDLSAEYLKMSPPHPWFKEAVMWEKKRDDFLRDMAAWKKATDTHYGYPLVILAGLK